MVSDVTSVIFHEIFDFRNFRRLDTKAWPYQAPALRICLAIWHHESKATCEKTMKNIVGPNEFTDFEKFEVEHPENIKTMFARNSANHPGDGITLRQNRSLSHILMCKASAARQWNSRQRRKLIENQIFIRYQRQFFIKFWIFKILGSMTPNLVRTKLRRYAFV